MPIYEFQCDAEKGGCGCVFEVLQKLNDPLPFCPECGKKRKVKKLISVPSLRFIGSGFYINDYGSGSGRKSNQ